MLVRHAAALLCTLGLLSVAALELPSGDSLRVTLAGAGGGVFHAPSGSKGFADGVVYLAYRHQFTENVVAKVAIRGSEELSTPFIHQGWLGWERNAFSIHGGFLTQRFGACRFYGPHHFLNPLFDTYLLWDTHGMGARISQGLGRWRLGGGFGINNRESGSVHLTPSYHSPHWSARALAGFQSYDVWEQDNLLALGGEVTADYDRAGAHLLAVYERYFGYGHETNVTMEPGWEVDGYAELFVDPIESLEFTALVRYRHYRKRYEHDVVFGGARLAWYPLRWLGGGAGFEGISDDGVYTTVPSVFVDLKPAADKAQLRLLGSRRQTGGAQPTYTVAGTVWIDL